MASQLLLDIALILLIVGGQALFLHMMLGGIFTRLCLYYVQEHKISFTMIDEYCETAKIPFQIPFVLADYLKKKRKRGFGTKIQVLVGILAVLAIFGLGNVVLLIGGLNNNDFGLEILGILGLIQTVLSIFWTNYIARKIIPIG